MRQTACTPYAACCLVFSFFVCFSFLFPRSLSLFKPAPEGHHCEPTQIPFMRVTPARAATHQKHLLLQPEKDKAVTKRPRQNEKDTLKRKGMFQNASVCIAAPRQNSENILRITTGRRTVSDVLAEISSSYTTEWIMSLRIARNCSFLLFVIYCLFN